MIQSDIQALNVGITREISSVTVARLSTNLYRINHEVTVFGIEQAVTAVERQS
jgi:hypothetical protein